MNPAGPRSLGRVARDSWSTLQAIGHGTESPRTAGRPRGISVTGPSHPGGLVDSVDPWRRARVTWESWSNPRAHRDKPDSPRRAGRYRRPSDTDPSHPGKLVTTAGPRSLSQVSWESWSTPRGLRPRPRSPVTAGRPRRTSRKSLSVSRQGQVVDPAEPRARPRIIWDSCSNRGPRTRVRVAQES